jgi:regulatory protein
VILAWPPGKDARSSDQGEARRKAMQRLARREYGKEELVKKLLDDGYEPAVARAAVDRLQAECLQDDRRFAASFIRSRIGQGKGPVRIRADLQQRGIDPAFADELLAGCGEDWPGLARRVRDRKYGEEPPADFREKARQMRFLQYRGFESWQIRAAVSSGDDD